MAKGLRKKASRLNSNIIAKQNNEVHFKQAFVLLNNIKLPFDLDVLKMLQHKVDANQVC